MLTEYEYGVEARGGILHRSRMTEQEARAWVQEWEDDGGAEGVFHVVRRPFGGWERC